MAKMMWPKNGSRKARSPAKSPKMMMSSRMGTTSRFASRDESDTCPKYQASTGSVASCAESVMARFIAMVSGRLRARNQARKTGAKKMRPAVARYESSKLMWKSSSGFQSSIKRPVKSRM